MTAGPAIVAVGGGHGLAATLQAAVRLTDRLAAVVTVADDGGSTGRLRVDLGLPGMGDIRRCLEVVADPAQPVGRSLGYRFEEGELKGHAVGNLLISGLTEAGLDFCDAVAEVARLAGATAEVLPATCDTVTLRAHLRSGGVVDGQVAVALAGPIARVELVPPAPVAHPPAVEAILAADHVLLGPGSLYTSVLAAAAVPGISAALAASRATVTWVANLFGQVTETDDYTLADHLDALAHHGIRVDRVLAHSGALDTAGVSVDVVEAPVAKDNGLAHDPARLAHALAALVG